MPRIRTDTTYWESVIDRIPDFMGATYDHCDDWSCSVPAKTVLARFKKYVEHDGDISYHTFYNELRRLGYELPVVNNYDSNTRVKGIRLKGI